LISAHDNTNNFPHLALHSTVQHRHATHDKSFRFYSGIVAVALMVSLVPAAQSAVPAPAPKLKAASKPSLLRRGTIRKADDAGLDMDSLSAPPSPAKRARVTFKEEVEEKLMESSFKPKLRSLESVRAEVKRSVDGHLRGDSEAYDALRSLFSPKREGEEDSQDEEVDLKTYVIALTGYASMLNSKCKGLVHNIVDFEWMGRDEGFVKAYVHFLGSLASSQGAYIQSILDMLVQRFAGGKLHLQPYRTCLT